MTICLKVCVDGVYGPHTASILQYGSYTEDYKEKTDKSESMIVHIFYTPDQMKVHMANIPEGGALLAPHTFIVLREEKSVRTVSSSENSLFRKCAALPFG